MSECIITAIVGLIGAIIGGLFTWFSVDRQLKIEKKEKQDIAVAITKYFLIKEIKANYKILVDVDRDNKLIRLLKREVDGTTKIPSFVFKYDEFNKIKYDIVKYNVQEILDVIIIYKAFELLQENWSKDYIELKEDEKESIRKGIIKCENMIKSS